LQADFAKLVCDCVIGGGADPFSAPQGNPDIKHQALLREQGFIETGMA
jgi:hypothetical protein